MTNKCFPVLQRSPNVLCIRHLLHYNLPDELLDIASQSSMIAYHPQRLFCKSNCTKPKYSAQHGSEN